MCVYNKNETFVSSVSPNLASGRFFFFNSSFLFTRLLHCSLRCALIVLMKSYLSFAGTPVTGVRKKMKRGGGGGGEGRFGA